MEYFILYRYIFMVIVNLLGSSFGTLDDEDGAVAVMDAVVTGAANKGAINQLDTL